MSELEELIVLLRNSSKAEFIIHKEVWQPYSCRVDDLNEAWNELSDNATVKISKYHTDDVIKVIVEKIQ